MKIKKTKRGFDITFESTKEDQVGVADLLAGLSGKPLPPKCDACGGVTDGSGPGRARCTCEKV